jgi:hypothetical protein
MEINERFFREDMENLGAREYLDDLDSGRMLRTVAYNFATEEIKRAIAALVQSRQMWRETTENTAKLRLGQPEFNEICDQIFSIANKEVGARLGYRYRMIDITKSEI